tara:strand:- start:492 stop:1187 length:696 start_codon:yes stop_codon:yes gene_type:complete
VINLESQLLEKIDNASIQNNPFEHFEIRSFLPDHIYDDFIHQLPETQHYTPLMHKKTLVNGQPTRYEIALNRIPQNNGSTKKIVDFFYSSTFKDAVLKKFDVAIQVQPYPHLYRDLSGFQLPPHTDIPEKTITFGFYLPKDDRFEASGLDLFEQAGSSFSPIKKIKYLPNTAFAFLRSGKSWHGASHKPECIYERNSLFVTFYNKSNTIEGKICVNDPNMDRRAINLDQGR